MIYVTHDQVEAMTLADKLVVLSGGKIMQAGPPLELYNRPANRFVAGFIGSPRMNFFKGAIVSASETGGAVRLDSGGEIATQPLKGAPGQRVSVGIRPEHFAPAADSEGPVKGSVRFVERLGASNFAYVGAAGAEDEVIAQLPGDARVNVGATLTLSVAPNAAHVFDEAGEALLRAPN
jgi:multiple sugar transport system ATP-binding protein